MELRAKIQQNQVRVFKQLTSMTQRVSMADAKHLYNTGRVTKCNVCFARLAEHNFDAKSLINYYKQRKDND